LENYFFMRPLLRLLAQGPFMCKATSMMLRVFAALIILGSLASFFNAGKAIFELPTTSAIMGGILFQLFFIVAIYAVTHVLLIRAQDIEDLQVMSVGDIYMLPLGAVLLRMLGEAYSSFIGLIAIGGGIYVWFTSKNIGTILGPLTAFFPAMLEASFIGGIQFMLTGILIAIGALIASYMLAEIISLIARSARLSVHTPRQLPRQGIKTRVG